MTQQDFIDYAKRKKITGKLLVIFMVTMVLLTFFSNTINNFTLPRVTGEIPISGVLIKELSGEGTVEAKSVLEEYVDTNLKVLDVNVEVGDSVRIGQPIMCLDIADLQTSLQDENARYEQQKITLEMLKDSSNLLDFNNNVRTALDNLEKQKKNYQDIKILHDIGGETSTNLKNAEVAMNTAADNYNSAVQAKEGFIRNNQRDIKNAELALEIQARKLESIKKRVSNGGVYTAQADGIITELNFSAGTMANGSKPLFRLAETTGGFQFTVSVDRELINYVKPGDEVDVAILSLGDKAISGQIAEIREDLKNGDNKELVIAVNDEELKGGENAYVAIRKKTKQYQTLIPNKAVYSDNDGYYVYVIRKKDAPLGTDNYVQRVDVKIEDSDSTKSAVVTGFMPNDKVVTQSTKSLSDGSRVVVKQ